MKWQLNFRIRFFIVRRISGKKTFFSSRNCDNSIESNLAIRSSFILFYFFLSNDEEKFLFLYRQKCIFRRISYSLPRFDNFVKFLFPYIFDVCEILYDCEKLRKKNSVLHFVTSVDHRNSSSQLWYSIESFVAEIAYAIYLLPLTVFLTLLHINPLTKWHRITRTCANV